MYKKRYIDSDDTELVLYIYTLMDNSFYDKEYFKLGFYYHHRLDGPAVEYTNGDYSWYKEGLAHRIGGPAHYNDNNCFYWINGKKVEVYYIYG